MEPLQLGGASVGSVRGAHPASLLAFICLPDRFRFILLKSIGQDKGFQYLNYKFAGVKCLGMARGPDPETSDFDILQFMVQHPTPAFIAKEIADRFDITEQTARNRLNQLHDKGYIHKKKPGENTVFFWISDEGMAYYASESGNF